MEEYVSTEHMNQIFEFFLYLLYHFRRGENNRTPPGKNGQLSESRRYTGRKPAHGRFHRTDRDLLSTEVFPR